MTLSPAHQSPPSGEGAESAQLEGNSNPEGKKQSSEYAEDKVIRRQIAKFACTAL